MKKSFLMFSLTNAADGRDEEFNDWYSNVHIGELLQLEGIESAQRFRIVIGGEWRYITIYSVETDNPQALFENIYRAAGDGTLQMSDSWHPEHYVGIAEAIDEHPVR